MTMDRFGKLGFFIIKFIEERGIDNKVGVGKGEPQIYFIPNEGHLIQADSNFLEECNLLQKNLRI